MTGHLWGTRLSDEQSALIEVLDALAQEHLVRDQDTASERITAARRVLAEHGLWTLGVAEEHGGGGADVWTTGLAIARIAAAWPAIGLAAAHAHAAGLVLGGHHRGQALLDEISKTGRPVAVVDLASDLVQVARHGDRYEVRVARVDVTAPTADLVVLVDDRTAAIVPAQRALFGETVARTGLDGAVTVPVEFDLDLAADGVVGMDVTVVRCRLYACITAVAAGLAQAAATGARAYAAERVQFGAPLTALPTMREALFTQAATAVVAITGALAAPDSFVATAALMDHALATAVDVAASALQAHGGYGYLVEYPAEGLLRDAVSLRAAAEGVRVRASAAGALVAR
jgi:alkylation response protein AidB-like acyl-CoA dehydrogenase